mmetsp:Transcript_2901/g.8079  ORF Transcript_2901/g.8079 Transcript_2901/m.8079 type:complete len:298 (+) Transcript_2901:1413-2306(+)
MACIGDRREQDVQYAAGHDDKVEHVPRHIGIARFTTQRRPPCCVRALKRQLLHGILILAAEVSFGAVNKQAHAHFKHEQAKEGILHDIPLGQCRIVCLQTNDDRVCDDARHRKHLEGYALQDPQEALAAGRGDPLRGQPLGAAGIREGGAPGPHLALGGELAARQELVAEHGGHCTLHQARGQTFRAGNLAGILLRVGGLLHRVLRVRSRQQRSPPWPGLDKLPQLLRCKASVSGFAVEHAVVNDPSARPALSVGCRGPRRLLREKRGHWSAHLSLLPGRLRVQLKAVRMGRQQRRR